MAKVWSYFFVKLWILFIISSGIYLFSRGFLLSRRVRTEHNECIRLKPCDFEESEVRDISTFLVLIFFIYHVIVIIIAIQCNHFLNAGAKLPEPTKSRRYFHKRQFIIRLLFATKNTNHSGCHRCIEI